MTYSTLYARVLDETDRTDITDVRFQYWLRDFEAYGNRVIRARGIVQRDEALISDLRSTVPDDFLKARVMRLRDAPYTPLKQLTILQMAQAQAAGPASGPLSAFSITGPEFEYYPPPSLPGTWVTLEYEQYIPPLTAAAPTNWLRDLHPDTYFRGVMWQAGAWLKDSDVVSLNKAAMDEGLAQIKSAELHDAFGSNITPQPSTLPV